jgi:hypothetical protein
MQWQMVWINDSNVVAPGVVVYDEVPVGTHFEALPAGDHISADGVYCEARGASLTTGTFDDNCYYEGPSNLFPRGRVVWKGKVASDYGITTEAEAENEVVIRFTSVMDNANSNEEIVNQATSEWDFNNDGTADTTIVTKSDEDEANTTFTPLTEHPDGGNGGNGGNGGGNNPDSNQGTPKNVPTLSEWLLILLAMVLLTAGIRESRKFSGKKF